MALLFKEDTSNILIGTPKLGDTTYTIKDAKRGVPLEKLDLKSGFCGGRVKQLAETDTKGLYLCLEEHNVIALYILLPVELTKKQIMSVLDYKGIDYPSKATKKELLALLGIEVEDE